ncbi:hypothetical protein D3C86_1324410 [compost metagenome]
MAALNCWIGNYFFYKALELIFCTDTKISKLLSFDHMFLECMTTRDLFSQKLRIEPALIDSAFCAGATFCTPHLRNIKRLIRLRKHMYRLTALLKNATEHRHQPNPSKEAIRLIAGRRLARHQFIQRTGV